ncbi:acyl-CoA thioesterase [Rhodothermus profundi]|uniref:Acyl-CoA thioester hydrolase n=1 Tax=Rhodothermus profundi TaxID=633813 RepID=A0A1M6TT00_9BACT|nr:thioesterase family protein [Rhodothermus profundi]SHK60030.1 acyl-CoA thioester hydrolase [Rhodothermus profundi]
MIRHVYQHRVRYRECDPMGMVYHAHYVDYLEAARTEALRALGLPYRELEDAGIIMPVVDLRLRFHQPAYYDELLDIITIIRELPRARLHLDYEVRRHETQELLATGQVTLCFVDRARNRPVRAPRALLDVLQKALTSPLSTDGQP